MQFKKMNRIILVSTFLMVYTIGLSQSGAKIEFLNKDNTIDYGKISKELDSGIRYIEFQNTGDVPLLINNVQSTCSCMTFAQPNDPILAGKRGKIEIKYNLSLGTIRKIVTVESNAINYEHGKIPLKIIGKVIR